MAGNTDEDEKSPAKAGKWSTELHEVKCVEQSCPF
jgi:hypothetical protein